MDFWREVLLCLFILHNYPKDYLFNQYLIYGLLKTLWVFTRMAALSYAKLANPTCQALNIVADSTPPLCCATSQHTEAHWSYTSAKSIGQTDCKLSDKPTSQTSYLKPADYHQVINDVLSVSNLNHTQVGYYSCYFCTHNWIYQTFFGLFCCEIVGGKQFKITLIQVQKKSCSFLWQRAHCIEQKCEYRTDYPFIFSDEKNKVATKKYTVQSNMPSLQHKAESSNEISEG